MSDLENNAKGRSSTDSKSHHQQPGGRGRGSARGRGRGGNVRSNRSDDGGDGGERWSRGQAPPQSRNSQQHSRGDQQQQRRGKGRGKRGKERTKRIGEESEYELASDDSNEEFKNDVTGVPPGFEAADVHSEFHSPSSGTTQTLSEPAMNKQSMYGLLIELLAEEDRLREEVADNAVKLEEITKEYGPESIWMPDDLWDDLKPAIESSTASQGQVAQLQQMVELIVQIHEQKKKLESVRRMVEFAKLRDEIQRLTKELRTDNFGYRKKKLKKLRKQRKSAKGDARGHLHFLHCWYLQMHLPRKTASEILTQPTPKEAPSREEAIRQFVQEEIVEGLVLDKFARFIPALLETLQQTVKDKLYYDIEFSKGRSQELPNSDEAPVSMESTLAFSTLRKGICLRLAITQHLTRRNIKDDTITEATSSGDNTVTNKAENVIEVMDLSYDVQADVYLPGLKERAQAFLLDNGACEEEVHPETFVREVVWACFP